MATTRYTDDSVVNTIIEGFINRSNKGLETYGTTLDRNDLSSLEWINHLQEELMDAILYLQKIKNNLDISK